MLSGMHWMFSPLLDSVMRIFKSSHLVGPIRTAIGALGPESGEFPRIDLLLGLTSESVKRVLRAPVRPLKGELLLHQLFSLLAALNTSHGIGASSGSSPIAP
jgi:hypothetical protein